MDIRDLYQQIDSRGVPAGKPLLQELIRKGEAGFRMSRIQANSQCDSRVLLDLRFATWGNGKLSISPQVIEELKH